MTTFRIIRTDRNLDPSTLTGAALLIGQGQGNALVLPHPTVAPVHAGIKWQAGAFWLSALAEAVTMLDGEAIQHAQLHDGDVVRVGAYLLLVEIQGNALQLTVEFSLALSQSDVSEVLHAPDTTTPTEQRALESFWARYLEKQFADKPWPTRHPWLWEATTDLRRYKMGRVAVISGLVLCVVAVLASWAFPEAYTPGTLSDFHARTTPPPPPEIAQSASAGRCTACHTLTGSPQTKCIACHSTAAFQADLSAKHQTLRLECRACHAEHRGPVYEPGLVLNEVCLHCHRAEDAAPPAAAATVKLPAAEPLGQPHGAPVAYPVKQGLWLWEGLSQTHWTQRGLPGQTADYNLREQFHMLHGQGARAGRTQCSDCHLGGTTEATLKRNVREACAQCHSLQPEFATELARSAAQEPLKEGSTRCVKCHAQHGAERDARASARKDN